MVRTRLLARLLGEVATARAAITPSYMRSACRSTYSSTAISSVTPTRSASRTAVNACCIWYQPGVRPMIAIRARGLRRSNGIQNTCIRPSPSRSEQSKHSRRSSPSGRDCRRSTISGHRDPGDSYRDARSSEITADGVMSRRPSRVWPVSGPSPSRPIRGSRRVRCQTASEALLIGMPRALCRQLCSCGRR